MHIQLRRTYGNRAPHQAAVKRHITVPPVPNDLLDGARPPPSSHLPPFEDIFVPRVRGEKKSTSDDARRNCTLEKFDSMLERNSTDGSICWVKTTEGLSRKADKYHRWNNKDESKEKDGWTRRKYILAHGKKRCIKNGHGFDLFEFEHTHSNDTQEMVAHPQVRTSLDVPYMIPPLMHGGDSLSYPMDAVQPMESTSWNPCYGVFSQPVQYLAHTMQPREEILSNGAANTFFSQVNEVPFMELKRDFPDGNYHFASNSTMDDPAYQNVNEANNNESALVFPNIFCSSDAEGSNNNFVSNDTMVEQAYQNVIEDDNNELAAVIPNNFCSSVAEGGNRYFASNGTMAEPAYQNVNEANNNALAAFPNNICSNDAEGNSSQLVLYPNFTGSRMSVFPDAGHYTSIAGNILADPNLSVGFGMEGNHPYFDYQR